MARPFAKRDTALDRSLAEADLIILVRELVNELRGEREPVPDHEVRVVDDAGRALGERREGRLEFRGPSATSGYFQNEAKTRQLFHDNWLDTGDRGYLADGQVFITGRDLAESLADITTAINAASRNRVLVVFPEGTFTHRSGLLGFFLGGFKVASEAGLPIIPGALRGTRWMLRSDQWMPRKAAISVEIGEPVQPFGKDFASVLRLRDAVRNAILKSCGEADLNELIKPPMSNTNSNSETAR